ncbi:MAG: pyridoxal-phosphate dependent enzyme, partial [Anaerolineae bacterium]
AFKFRGAYNAISQLSPMEKEAGVITHSSGNHAQGVALAAQLLGVKAVVVMPQDAPAIKRAATAGYGAEIIPCPAIEREAVTEELVARQGYTLIHPYDNDQIIAGQGTAAWELFDEVGNLDALFVPVGGGGLISGSALAAAVQSPHCRVIGVEPELGNDANRSWRDGRIHTLESVPTTIADGLRTRFIGRRNLTVMQKYVADMTAVSEEAILQTLEFLWTRLKIIVEPSSAVALAPLFTGQYPLVGKRVGVILSGGNVDVRSFWAGVKSAEREAGSGERGEEKETREATAARKPAALVCTEMDEAAMAVLAKTAVLDHKPHLSPEELISQIGGYQAVIVDGKTRITDQIIEYGFDLRAIGVIASRLDNVDVSAVRDMGIAICHAPTGSAVAIAEHTLARMLMLSNQFGDGRLAGKTLGLVGFGRIGQQVARRAQAFDMNVLVNQPRLTPELALSAGVQAADLMDLLRQSDFVSLHVPYKTETSAIIGAVELAAMRSSACLINTGHTELVDESALSAALADGRLAGAAISSLPPEADSPAPAAIRLRQHKRALVSPHVTAIIGGQRRDMALHVAQQITKILAQKQANETLSLELVPIEQVLPHEQIDDKRVARLMGRLEDDGRLVNPPVTAFWHGRYIILDGATRFTAFKRLDYPHVIVQVVQPEQTGFELHTWYHAISNDQPAAHLLAHIEKIEGAILTAVSREQAQTALRENAALCYFLDKDGNFTLVQSHSNAERLDVMNALVAGYTAWGNVERTLLTDLPRLLAQFPQMTAVAIFPQFRPETVFDVASQGKLLPAGLTRFVIPGRILRLNAELARLKNDESLTAKRAWFNRFLEEKLARSRMRYYEEPVILLDE